MGDDGTEGGGVGTAAGKRREKTDGDLWEANTGVLIQAGGITYSVSEFKKCEKTDVWVKRT